MKRKWRRINSPSWLAPVGKALGMNLEERELAPLEMFLFKTHVLSTNPVAEAMVIGHWKVGPKALDRTHKRVHICVSKCGVIAGYQPGEIAGGRLPDTCYGCRPGSGPPPVTRIVLENELAKLAQHWNPENNMATAFEEKSSLNTEEGHRLWATQGREVLTELVTRTRFGQLFGWKVVVHRVVNLSHARPKAHRIKIQAIHKSFQSFELFIQGAGSPAGFTVDLKTARTDVKFTEVMAEIEKAIGIMKSLDTQGNYPDEAVKEVAAAVSGVPPAPSSTGSHNGFIDLSKLVKIQGGIANLLTVGKDLNEVAVLKDAARRKVEATNAKKGDMRVKLVEAEEMEKAATMKYNATNERVMQCETALRNALAAKENASVDKERAIEVAAAASEAYKPVEAEAAAAEKELKELEALEADRLKSVGDAKGLATLLEALSKIGG